MAGFNYNRFKEAVQKSAAAEHSLLMFDVEKVKAQVEKLLTMFLESSANTARTNYPGVEL